MSFLVHLSPLAYYSLRTASQNDTLQNGSPGWPFDISPSVIRKCLGRHDDRPSGATTATLELTSDVIPMSTSSNTTLSDFSSGLVLGASELLSQLEDSSSYGPRFLLPGTSVLSSLDHSLPEQNGMSVNGSQDQWVLDFTNGGTRKGLVMTHSRMRDIQTIVRKPSSASNSGNDFLHLPYSGNWVALLVRNAFLFLSVLSSLNVHLAPS